MLVGKQVLDAAPIDIERAAHAGGKILSPYGSEEYRPTPDHAWAVIRGVCLANRPAAVTLLDGVTPYAWDGDRLALQSAKPVIDAWVSTGLIDLANRATRSVMTGVRGVCFVRLAPTL